MGAALHPADAGRRGDYYRFPQAYAAVRSTISYAQQAAIPHLTRSSLHRLILQPCSIFSRALAAAIRYRIHTVVILVLIAFCRRWRTYGWATRLAGL